MDVSSKVAIPALCSSDEESEDSSALVYLPIAPEVLTLFHSHCMYFYTFLSIYFGIDMNGIATLQLKIFLHNFSLIG